MRYTIILTIAAFLIVQGCDQSALDSEVNEQPLNQVKNKSVENIQNDEDPPVIIVEDVDFMFPESVVHNENEDVYLVSNLGEPDEDGNPVALNNNGFISKVNPDGSLSELKWIEGGVNDVTLHGPTGLAIWGDHLYATDRDAIRIFDLETGDPVDTIPMEGVNLLNDICFAPNGDLYATETGLEFSVEAGDLVPTGTDAIYRIRKGVVSTYAEGSHLAGPNGCVMLGGNVVIASFFSNEIYRLNASGKKFTIAHLSGGGIDGIIRVNGSYYVTSWENESVIEVGLGGSREMTILSDISSPAALGYDAIRNRLLVPQLFVNSLVFLDLD